MYLVYNREYELVAELSDFSKVKEAVGEDLVEQDVNSLVFKRGKTVVTEDSIKRLVHGIVGHEKDLVAEYIAQDLESQEDETVDLRTQNKQLEERQATIKAKLRGISDTLGERLEELGGESPKNTPVTKASSVNAKNKDFRVTKSESESKTYRGSRGVLSSKEGVIRGANIAEIDKEADKEVVKEVVKEDITSVEKLVRNRRKSEKREINFKNIIENERIPQISQLKGSKYVKRDVVAEYIGLDREHVDYLLNNTLKECGGSVEYQNMNVLSPAEAVWVMVSALTKRNGYGGDKRFIKAQFNAVDFYPDWEEQKEDIVTLLK